jgi:hypothetical protein
VAQVGVYLPSKKWMNACMCALKSPNYCAFSHSSSLKSSLKDVNNHSIFYLLIYFGGTGTWTQNFALGCYTTWAIPSVHFALVSFWEMRVSQTICLGWPWTAILPISASQIARITGVSHQGLVQMSIF